MTIDERSRAAIGRLTDNEKQCLRRRLRAQTAKEMAIDLGVSPHAVEKRLKMARAKLGVGSSLQAARMLAAVEGYDALVPQPSDLAPEGASRQPSQRADGPRRVAAPMLAGVIAMILIAATALFAAFQSTADAPSRTNPPGEPVTNVAMRKASPEEVRAFLASSFEATDRDRSGFIEHAEAPERGIGLGAPHPVGKASPSNEPVRWVGGKLGQAMWIARADSDGDGRISRTEYVETSLPIFMDRGIPANWKPR